MISWGGLRMVRIEKQSMNRMDQDSPRKKPSHFVFTFKQFFPRLFLFQDDINHSLAYVITMIAAQSCKSFKT